MTWVMYVDVFVGLAMSLTVLVLAVRSGRQLPVHVVVWGIALGLLVLRSLFSLAIGMGVLFSSDRTWAFAIGATALALIIPTAIIRPRWAGIALVVSAVVQPALLFVVGRAAQVSNEEFPVEVMLGFYSLTVAIIGGLLIISTLGRPAAAPTARAAAPGAKASGTPASRSADVSGS